MLILTLFDVYLKYVYLMCIAIMFCRFGEQHWTSMKRLPVLVLPQYRLTIKIQIQTQIQIQIQIQTQVQIQIQRQVYFKYSFDEDTRILEQVQ